MLPTPHYTPKSEKSQLAVSLLTLVNLCNHSDSLSRQPQVNKAVSASLTKVQIPALLTSEVNGGIMDERQAVCAAVSVAASSTF